MAHSFACSATLRRSSITAPHRERSLHLHHSFCCCRYGVQYLHRSLTQHLLTLELLYTVLSKSLLAPDMVPHPLPQLLRQLLASFSGSIELRLALARRFEHLVPFCQTRRSAPRGLTRTSRRQDSGSAMSVSGGATIIRVAEGSMGAA